MRTINFNKNKLQQLKDAYTMAKQKGADQFDFEGHTVLLAYAKYLIEYLEMNFHTESRKIQISERNGQ